MDILGNPWVIGIGGGIISGILVTLITRHLFSRREQKEYRQRIETANNEIIYAVRPSIAEKMLPSRSILDSLLSSTARKYAVTKSDLYSLAGLSNELIKEIMDNTFLASQQKIEFCELISTLKEIEEQEDKKRIEIVTVTKNESFDPSILLGLMTGIMAVMMVFYTTLKDKDIIKDQFFSDKFIPLVLMTLLIPMLAYLSVKLKNIFFSERIDSKERTIIERLKIAEEMEKKNNKSPNKANAADAKSHAAD